MNLKDIIDKNSEQTVTNLYGEEIIISRERKIYADIYSKYEIVARESTAIFQRLYSEHYDILKKLRW